MLEKKIIEGFGIKEDYNCAETILCGANEAYQLNLDQRSLKLASVFGGGAGTGRLCGAVASALMVIGMENTETVAHQSPEVREMAIKFQESYIEKMGSVDCSALKDKHWNEEVKCRKVIQAAAKILDTYMKEEE